MALALRNRPAPVDTEVDEDAALLEWMREATRTGPPPPPPAKPPPYLRPRDARAGRRATRTVVVWMVLGNLAVTVAMIAVGHAQHWDPTKSLWASLLVAAGYYSVVACVIALRSDDLGLRPVWLIGPAPTAIGVGAAVGGAVAVGLSAVMTLALGHPMTDPTAGLLAGNKNLVMLLAGFGVIAIAAPFVEELVFRGFLAEALRGRGKKSAIILSGVAFSVAHLRFAQFRYYLIMGIGFGILYWGRGLIASMAAHVAFNGMLILLAVASVHGPMQTLLADRLSLSLPATWHTVAAPASVDLAVLGPSGASVGVSHFDLPAGASFDIERLADALRRGTVPFPGGARVDPKDVRVATLPFGSALRARATVHGHQDDTVLAVIGGKVVVFEMVANGSAEAARDFERMLNGAKLTA